MTQQTVDIGAGAKPAVTQPTETPKSNKGKKRIRVRIFTGKLKPEWVKWGKSLKGCWKPEAPKA